MGEILAILFVFVVLIIGQLIVSSVVARKREDKNAGLLAAGIYWLAIAIFAQWYADEFGVALIQYFGMAFAVDGISNIIFAFYNRLTNYNTEPMAPISKVNLQPLTKTKRVASEESAKPMYCPVCGAPHGQSETSCRKCGTNFG